MPRVIMSSAMSRRPSLAISNRVGGDDQHMFARFLERASSQIVVPMRGGSTLQQRTRHREGQSGEGVPVQSIHPPIHQIISTAASSHGSVTRV